MMITRLAGNRTAAITSLSSDRSGSCGKAGSTPAARYILIKLDDPYIGARQAVALDGHLPIPVRRKHVEAAILLGACHVS